MDYEGLASLVGLATSGLVGLGPSALVGARPFGRARSALLNVTVAAERRLPSAKCSTGIAFLLRGLSPGDSPLCGNCEPGVLFAPYEPRSGESDERCESYERSES
jgi:hypothetical protein